METSKTCEVPLLYHETLKILLRMIMGGKKMKGTKTFNKCGSNFAWTNAAKVPFQFPNLAAPIIHGTSNNSISAMPSFETTP